MSRHIEEDEILSQLHYDTADVRTDTNPSDDERKGVIAVGSYETEKRKARFEYSWRGHEETTIVFFDTDEVILSCDIEYWNGDNQVVGIDAEHYGLDQHGDLEDWVSDHFTERDPVEVLTEQFNDRVPEHRRPQDKSIQS